MKNIVIGIPDESYDRVIEGICSTNSYMDKDEDGMPNPVTKEEYAHQVITGLILRQVVVAETPVSVEAAREAVKANVEQIDISVSASTEVV